MNLLHRFATPKRLRETLQYSEVEENRLDGCPFYSSCLEYCAESSWTSFTCRLCRIFIEERERQVIQKLGIIGLNRDF